MSVSLTWLGHAAFLLESGGVRVMLDPYKTPEAGNYAPIETPADLILVSHLNPKYHSHWEASPGSPIRLNGLDFAGDSQGVTALGIQFRAIPVWESPSREVPVSMPFFTMGGITLCHSGDLGHALSESDAAPVKGVDVFLAVAGGPPTIGLTDLKAAIDLIQPRIVIPMHYQTGKVNLPLLPVDDLLALYDESQIVHHPCATLDITREFLPSTTRIIVLPSAR